MNVEYIFAVTLFMIGLYALVIKKNLIKKIMGLSIITTSIHLFIISIGFRVGGIMPIVTDPGNLAAFSSLAVDPLPQAMVLTSIVIDVSITALALTIAIEAYRNFKTLNTDKMRRSHG